MFEAAGVWVAFGCQSWAYLQGKGYFKKKREDSRERAFKVMVVMEKINYHELC
jgi:hypothetical protein